MTRLAFALSLAAAALAAEPTVIPIWPGPPPGTESWTQTESEEVSPKDSIRRVSNVTRPTLTVYLPDAASATGTAMVICPGGGFRILAIDHEGHEVARWLNTLGVAAFVLKYRVMPTGDADEKAQATERRKLAQGLSIADARQAVKVVRAHAATWGLAPNRIGLMGFSAGGYAAAGVALQHDAESRPDFVAPIYPAAPDTIVVPADAPPLFMAVASDDKLLASGIRIYNAWREANIPAELHVYSKGGHGFGMKKMNLPVETWTDRMRDWLAVQGLLKRASQ